MVSRDHGLCKPSWLVWHGLQQVCVFFFAAEEYGMMLLKPFVKVARALLHWARANAGLNLMSSAPTGFLSSRLQRRDLLQLVNLSIARSAARVTCLPCAFFAGHS